MRITLSTIIGLLFIVTSCSAGKKQPEETVAPPTIGNYVEVLYFHGKQRCITCNAIEKLTKEALQENFADELDSGEVIFRVIDISEKQNEVVAEKYEVSWSSLFINRWDGVQETRGNMTEFGFLHAKSSPEVFKEGVKKKVSDLLNL